MNQELTTEKKKHWYDRHYKLLLVFSAVLIILSLIYLFQFYRTNGDIFHKDVSITGGTTVTVFIPSDVDKITQDIRARFPDAVVRGLSDLRTGQQQGFFVESTASADDLKKSIEEIIGTTLTNDNSSVEFTGSALSSSFYQQLRLALVIAFIFMAIVVFIIFRTFIPSIAVIGAAFADIIMTIVVIDFLKINLSLAGIVALLMLVGYSVDTDILLTTRVIRKGDGSINSRIYGAFKTGIMMTSTAIAAVTISLVFTYTLSDTLRQIFTILLIGLLFDIFNTWITNASIIKWYAEAKKL